MLHAGLAAMMAATRTPVIVWPLSAQITSPYARRVLECSSALTTVDTTHNIRLLNRRQAVAIGHCGLFIDVIGSTRRQQPRHRKVRLYARANSLETPIFNTPVTAPRRRLALPSRRLLRSYVLIARAIYNHRWQVTCFV